MAMLIDVSPGDVLSFDKGKINIEVLEKSGNRTRLSVTADKSISIEKTQNYSVEAEPKRAGLNKR